MPRTAACLLAAGGLTAGLVPGTVQAAQGAPTFQVIAQGLNSPRGVTVLRDGTVLVAEAGTGGRGPCTGTGQTRRCFGDTGSIYRVKGNRKGRIVRGLPSISDAAGREAMGPVHVRASGGGYLVLSGAGLNDAQRAQYGVRARRMGTLYQVRDGRAGRIVADLVAHETRLDPDWVLPRNDPGQAAMHANPWRMANARGGWMVTDAGANDLLRVTRGGRVHTEALFPHSVVTTGAALQKGRAAGVDDPRRLAPAVGGARQPRQVQSVPTGIVRAPDGAYYVAELGGITPRAARIWRVVPGRRPQVFVSGLTALSDLALDGRGNLVALSMTGGFGAGGTPSPGALYRIDLRTKARSEIPTGGRLTMATGMAIGRGGEIYVADNGVGNGAGRLVRVRS